jgi:hypothetical protein
MEMMRESGMRVPAGMMIIRLELEAIGPWGSFVGDWEVGARPCAHCNAAVNKPATVTVASLRMQSPFHADGKQNRAE